jgi:hypothetical protein
MLISTLASKVEPETGQEVSWDPVVCWDCPTTGEFVAFFVVGMLVCALIFLLIRRVRTHRRESETPRRFLE